MSGAPESHARTVPGFVLRGESRQPAQTPSERVACRTIGDNAPQEWQQGLDLLLGDQAAQFAVQHRFDDGYAFGNFAPARSQRQDDFAPVVGRWGDGALAT